jgi:hypothetical protein
LKNLIEMNEFYQNMDLSYLKVNVQIKAGDILAGRIFLDVGTAIFLRIQVFKIKESGDVCAYDIDEQKLRLIPRIDLFYLAESFYNFPTKVRRIFIFQMYIPQ